MILRALMVVIIASMSACATNKSDPILISESEVYVVFSSIPEESIYQIINNGRVSKYVKQNDHTFIFDTRINKDDFAKIILDNDRKAKIRYSE